MRYIFTSLTTDWFFYHKFSRNFLSSIHVFFAFVPNENHNVLASSPYTHAQIGNEIKLFIIETFHVNFSYAIGKMKKISKNPNLKLCHLDQTLRSIFSRSYKHTNVHLKIKKWWNFWLNFVYFQFQFKHFSFWFNDQLHDLCSRRYFWITSFAPNFS